MSNALKNCVERTKRNINVFIFRSEAHLEGEGFRTVFWLMRGHDADYVSGLDQCGAHTSLMLNY